LGQSRSLKRSFRREVAFDILFAVIGVGVAIRFAHFARLLPWLVTFASASVPAEAAEHVQYRASAGCPGVERFEEQVAARTRRSAALPFEVREVEVEALVEGARGRLVLSGRGQETTREIRAATCAEAVEALALIVAILLDPEADTRPHLTLRTEPRANRRSEPARPRPINRSYWGAGVEWSVLGGLAANPVQGPRVFIEIGRPPPERWFPSLRLSGLRATSGSMEQAGVGTAALRLHSARIDGCPLRWSNQMASIEPCLAIEAGMLRADSNGLQGSRAQALGWAAVNGLARGVLRYRERLTLHADLGIGLPLTRYRFRFSGHEPLYTATEVGFRGGIGVGMRFP
jgi:hypothetical protein